MKVGIEQLKQIKVFLSGLADDAIDAEWDGYLDEEEEDELPDEMEIEDIRLTFPDDQDFTCIPLEDFLYYMKEIESIRRVDDTIVRTDHIVQAIIHSIRIGYSGFDDELASYTFKDDGLTADIVKNPFLVGVMNAREGRYNEDFGMGSCEFYTAIEIRLTEEKDENFINNLIERICFYLTDRTGVAVDPWGGPDIQEMYDNEEEYYEGISKLDEPVKDEEEGEIDVSTLPDYSPLLKMFRQAKGVFDPEIRFLQYYKIIEYVSPVVAKTVAYEHLNKRLDLLPRVNRDYKYLDSILAVVRRYDKDLRDDSLAEAVLENCVDVVPLYEMLPKRLLKKVKGELKFQKDAIKDSDVSEEQLRGLQDKIASILYATRNSIVHAKSNYVKTGYEMKEDEMEEANEMIEIIARSIINWNQRQAEGFRV